MESTQRLKEVIAAWLELTKDGLPQAGLEPEEALRRATELRARLRADETLRPPAVLDEESKDMLYVLVGLLSDSPAETRQERAREASAVYAFLSEALWTPDEFGEKEQLLKQCEALVLANEPDPTAASRTLARESEPALLQSASPNEEASAVFRDALPLLRLILLRRYRLTEIQSKALEEELHSWLLRFHRRLCGQDRSRLLAALFNACAEFASDYEGTDSTGADLAKQRGLAPRTSLRPVRSRPSSKGG